MITRAKKQMKKLSFPSILLLAALALLAACAGTGSTPKTLPPIADASVACPSRTSPVLFPAAAGEAEQLLERVVVSADPESATSLVARGWDSSRGNDRDTTVALFDLALTRPDSNTPADRIHWSYGWAMFNLHDHRCALAHFEQARQAAPDQVRWLPQTLAVTYWQLGERDAALGWYDEAARNEPGCWIDARAAERCTRRWLRQERRALGELLSEWKRRRFEDAENN